MRSLMKENHKCQRCSADYSVEWPEYKTDDYNNYVVLGYDNYAVPGYCPFCGTDNIEVDEDPDSEEE